MYTNSKSAVDRKENKQRNFAESETKHLVRSHNKNAENAIFRTHDEDTSILGERYNAGNNCRSKDKREAHRRWIDDIKSVTVCDRARKAAAHLE